MINYGSIRGTGWWFCINDMWGRGAELVGHQVSDSSYNCISWKERGGVHTCAIDLEHSYFERDPE